MSFKFRVYSVDGDDLPDYESTVPNWGPGDVIYRDGMPTHRITAVIPVDKLDNGEFAGIWEVEPLADDNQAATPS